MTREYDALLQAGMDAACSAGEVIAAHFRKLPASAVRRKGVNDFVTRVDLEAEAVIQRILAERCPGHGLLAEESGGDAAADWLWVIDPLDGTTNFIHGIPHFAVSLALLHGGRPEIGVIYDPMTRDRFHALSGQGAFLNDRPIVVSATSDPAAALGATGFPFKAPELRPAYARAFAAMMGRCKDMRRCGAAALDLAHVACGRYDFFWEAHLLPWDFLAGRLLVEEAGGLTGDFAGKELGLRAGSVLAANPTLYPLLLGLIARSFKPPAV